MGLRLGSSRPARRRTRPETDRSRDARRHGAHRHHQRPEHRSQHSCRGSRVNPLLGVFFHWLGGLSSASFYVPYKRIRRWSWEIFWITGGIFSWVFAPWLLASLQTHDLKSVLGAASARTLFWCWFWGAMWGFGGLTFGLT